MEFDQETLKPTYKLLLGIPGRSNGFRDCSAIRINPRLLMKHGHLLVMIVKTLNNMIGDLVEQRKKARERK